MPRHVHPAPEQVLLAPEGGRGLALVRPEARLQGRVGTLPQRVLHSAPVDPGEPVLDAGHHASTISVAGEQIHRQRRQGLERPDLVRVPAAGRTRAAARPFDVQRLFLLMEPHDGGLHRLLAIGRKRMPEPAERGLAPIGGARDDRDR